MKFLNILFYLVHATTFHGLDSFLSNIGFQLDSLSRNITGETKRKAAEEERVKLEDARVKSVLSQIGAAKQKQSIIGTTKSTSGGKKGLIGESLGSSTATPNAPIGGGISSAGDF